MLQDFGDRFFFQHLTVPFSDWFFQLGLKAAGWSTAAVAALLREESLFYDLEKIHVPTLILHGIHDKVCPFQFGEVQKVKLKILPLYHLKTVATACFGSNEINSTWN